MRQAFVYPGEDGLWVAECPSLPNCFSQGESREQAITNIHEAIEGYILALQDDKLAVRWGQQSAQLSGVSPVVLPWRLQTGIAGVWTALQH
jgi:predicted RNase H-like HicB family nuclease